MVGAAMLPRDRRVNGVRDSKMLTEAGREILFDRIASWCKAWAVGGASRTSATSWAWRPRRSWRPAGRSSGSACVPDAAVVDGKWDFVAPHVGHVELRIKADAALPVGRRGDDPGQGRRATAIMREHAVHYPHWRFDTNKGYPCPVHKAALQGYGPSVHPPAHVGVHGQLRAVARHLAGLPPRPRPAQPVRRHRRRPIRVLTVIGAWEAGFPPFHTRMDQALATVTLMPVMWAWLDSGSKLPGPDGSSALGFAPGWRCGDAHPRAGGVAPAVHHRHDAGHQLVVELRPTRRSRRGRS